jgi:hypothetical protein
MIKANTHQQTTRTRNPNRQQLLHFEYGLSQYPVQLAMGWNHGIMGRGDSASPVQIK